MWWSRVATLIGKDLRVELRTREILYTSLLFAAVLVVVFVFSGFEGAEVVAQAAPSVLWVSIAFVGTLIFSRTFQREQEGRAIHGLLLVPNLVDALYVAKLVVNVALLVCVELLLVPLVLMTFRVDASAALGPLFGVIALGTVGFCAMGTVLAASLATLRLREVILPLVLYPLCIPLLVAGVRATSLVLRPGVVEGQLMDWVKLLIAFDVIFLVLSRWLFGAAVDE